MVDRIEAILKKHFLNGVIADVVEYDEQERLVKEVLYEDTGDLFQVNKYFYSEGEIRVDCYDYSNYSNIEKYYQLFDEEGAFIESGNLN